MQIHNMWRTIFIEDEYGENLGSTDCKYLLQMHRVSNPTFACPLFCNTLLWMQWFDEMLGRIGAGKGGAGMGGLP